MTRKPDLTPAYWMGDPRRGAALGRATAYASAAPAGKFSLQRVYLDSGGYDSGGAYWGHGQRLYWYASEDGAADGYLRAFDRDDAKAAVRKLYPGARFYR
jgi:hypothetical protein